MPSAVDRTLEDGPHALDPVGVHRAPDILFGAMVHRVMIEGQAVVDARFVGIDGRARLDCRGGKFGGGSAIGIGDRLRDRLSATLAGTHDGCLADRPAPGAELLALVFVRFLPADIDLVHLDHIAEPEFATGASLADPVQHVPSRPVLDTQLFRELHGADALAGRHHAVDRHDPVLQRRLGRVHDRPGRDGEILAAMAAPVGVRLALGRADLVERATVSTGGQAVPADPLKPCDAGLLIREHPQQFYDADGLCGSFGLGHHPSPCFPLAD